MLHRLGVELGMEEGIKGPLLHMPNLTAIGATITPKLKILLRFDQNVEYKRPLSVDDQC